MLRIVDQPSDGYSEKIALTNVDCADLDQYGRLIAARGGILYNLIVGDRKELLFSEIADFNSQVPEDIQAPQHTTRW